MAGLIDKVFMSNYENLLLNNQLCFALYASSNAITKLFNQKLVKLNLTYPQFLVLLVLWEADGVPVKDLSQKLKLDSGTLTPLLKRLEKAGVIRRERSQHDGRFLTVSLTDQGKDLEHKVAKIQEEVACETELSETEFAELRGKLYSLLETMTSKLHEKKVA